jgi:lysophospholipase L1-like esterase
MTTHDPNPPELPRDIGLLDVEEVVETTVLEPEGGESRQAYPPGTFRKIGAALLTLHFCIVASYVVPALSWARPWTTADPVPFWNIVGREILGEGEAADAAEEEAQKVEALAAELADDRRDAAPVEDKPVVQPPPDGDDPAKIPAYTPHPDDAQEVTQALELPSPTALDPFLEQLTKTDLGWAGEITRITMWGDSVIANDNVSSAARFEMQRRFGDSGHGFHLLAKPNASYKHKGVRFSDGEAWSRCYIINKCKSDGHYGLGGTTVWSSGGAESRFRTEDEIGFGRKVSRFEVWYAAQPKGGSIRVKIDDQEPQTIDTAADALEDRWQVFEVEDGAHDIRVRAAGGGQVRLYGVVMERDVPGVVWDGMEELGAFTSRMLYFDADHIRRQIEHRGTDLLVFMFGGNDLLLPKGRHDQFEEDLRQMLRRFRAMPDAPACVVMSPVDHGERTGPRVVSVATIEPLVAIQRKVALEEGCAFFDTYAAMGGEGSAGRWRKRDPPLISGDLAHLTNAGQKVIGRMLYLALMKEYAAYRTR